MTVNALVAYARVYLVESFLALTQNRTECKYTMANGVGVQVPCTDACKDVINKLLTKKVSVPHEYGFGRLLRCLSW